MLRYAVVESGVPFSFPDASVGRLVSLAGIDRETDAQFSFTVKVFNPAAPAEFGTAAVVIAVGELNDNTPASMTHPCSIPRSIPPTL